MINANFKIMTKNLSKTRIHLLSEIKLHINLVKHIYIWIYPDIQTKIKHFTRCLRLTCSTL